MGPYTEPWGTPDNTGTGSDRVRATDRHCRQMRRKNIFGTKKNDLAKTSGEKKFSP